MRKFDEIFDTLMESFDGGGAGAMNSSLGAMGASDSAAGDGGGALGTDHSNPTGVCDSRLPDLLGADQQIKRKKVSEGKKKKKKKSKCKRSAGHRAGDFAKRYGWTNLASYYNAGGYGHGHDHDGFDGSLGGIVSDGGGGFGGGDGGGGGGGE